MRFLMRSFGKCVGYLALSSNLWCAWQLFERWQRCISANHDTYEHVTVGSRWYEYQLLYNPWSFGGERIPDSSGLRTAAFRAKKREVGAESCCQHVFTFFLVLFFLLTAPQVQTGGQVKNRWGNRTKKGTLWFVFGGDFRLRFLRAFILTV